MPPAVIAAGIGAASALGGAALQSRSANRSVDAQTRANQQAMDYERQKQAEAKAQRDQAAAAYRTAWNAWYARNGEEGVRRYGVPVGITIPTTKAGATAAVKGAPLGQPSGPVAPPPGAGGQSAMPPAPGASMGAQDVPMPQPYTPGPGVAMPQPYVPETKAGIVGAVQGGSLGQMAGAPPAGGQPEDPNVRRGSLGDMGGWADWSRYGA